MAHRNHRDVADLKRVGQTERQDPRQRDTPPPRAQSVTSTRKGKIRTMGEGGRWGVAALGGLLFINAFNYHRK